MKMTNAMVAALSDKAMEIANEAAKETKKLLKEIDDYASAHPFDDLQEPPYTDETDLMKCFEEWDEVVAEWSKPVEALFDKLVVPVETLRELTEHYKDVSREYSDLVQLVDDYAIDWSTHPTYDR